MVLLTILGALALSALAFAAPFESHVQLHDTRSAATIKNKSTTAKPHTNAKPAPFCYPSLGFVPPLTLPKTNADWWCDPSTEYAFVGFSYEVTACEYRPS